MIRKTRSHLGALISTALLIFVTQANAQTIIYVDRYAAIGSNDGTSWETAFRTLQDALAVAVSGGSIRVARGRYWPDEGSGQTNNDPPSTLERG